MKWIRSQAHGCSGRVRREDQWNPVFRYALDFQASFHRSRRLRGVGPMTTHFGQAFRTPHFRNSRKLLLGVPRSRIAESSQFTRDFTPLKMNQSPPIVSDNLLVTTRDTQPEGQRKAPARYWIRVELTRPFGRGTRIWTRKKNKPKKRRRKKTSFSCDGTCPTESVAVLMWPPMCEDMNDRDFRAHIRAKVAKRRRKNCARRKKFSAGKE